MQRAHHTKTKDQTNPFGVLHQIQPSAPKLKENPRQRLEPNKQQQPEATVPQNPVEMKKTGKSGMCRIEKTGEKWIV